jgi:hypothetical protein
MRLVHICSRAVAILLLPCASAHVALAQAPGTGTDSYTILFRSQSTTGDFVAVSVDGPRAPEEVHELICEIADDDRINIGASRTLQIRMYTDILASEYVPQSYLRFVDDDSRAVFQTQEEQVLAAYYWVSSEPMAQMFARGGWLMPPGLELMMDGQGASIRPGDFREFDHMLACGGR